MFTYKRFKKNSFDEWLGQYIIKQLNAALVFSLSVTYPNLVIIKSNKSNVNAIKSKNVRTTITVLTVAIIKT